MKQVATVNASLLKVMASSAFVRGFNEVKKGKAFDYDAYEDPRERNATNKRWNYERGRLFGHVYSGPLKQGNKIDWSARLAMGIHFHSVI